jgi:hypothetical protein
VARSGHPGRDPGLPAAGRDRASLGRENPGPGDRGQAVHYAYTRGYADPPEPR